MDLDPDFVTALAGRYEFERELGRGGMAIVYLARDVKHDRSVALKVLRPELAASLGAERFLREIAITASLVHPNILALYDSGQAAESLYYVMPYVNGPTLGQRLKREAQLPIDDALAISRQIAAALDYAHARGVIHRDIKPDNILLLGDHVLVADFGLARAVSSAASSPLTDKRFVVGTALYMSPEQCTPGRAVDARSDIYSLGCVVFEMITGVPPFRGATADATMTHHLTSDPPSLLTERRSCPSTLDDVVRRALAKAPADRFRTAGEFAQALAAAGPTPIPTRPTKPSLTRARTITAAKVVASLVVLLAVVGFVWRWVGAPSIRLGDRDWLLVADFQGPGSEPALSTTVRELVTTELNQSRSLRTVTRQQLNSVMRLAGVPETTHVDADLARQLAVRSAVRAIVVGSVDRLAKDRYSLAIHVVSAEDGRNLYSVARSSNGEELVSAVGEAARDVRRELGEKRKAIERTLPLVEAATPSFLAFQEYVEGLASARRGDAAGSNALLHQALDTDKDFALAWIAIGVNHLSARQLDSSNAAFRKALAIPGRLTQAQKYRLQGDIAYSIEYDVPAALRWYDLYLAEYPNSIGGRSNRALYASALGRYADAVTTLRAAVAMNPFGAAYVQLPLFNLAAMLIPQGPAHFREATDVIRDLTPPWRWGASVALMVASDRWAEALRFADSIASQPKAPAFMHLLGTTARASALTAMGSGQEASRILRRGRDQSSGATARWFDRADLLSSVAVGERPQSASALTDTSAAGATAFALRAAVAGDTVRARALLHRVDSASAHDRALLGSGPALVQGWIDARGGRWSDVTQALSAASLAGEHDATILDRVSSVELRWLVANAYAAQGKLDSAVLHMKAAISPERVPIGHVVLRGLVLPAARQRIDKWSKAH